MKKKMMKIMNKMMLSCEEAAILISKKQHQKLSFKEGMDLRFHKMACSFCRLYEAELKIMSFTFQKLKTKETHHHLSEEKKQKMKDAIS